MTQQGLAGRLIGRVSRVTWLPPAPYLYHPFHPPTTIDLHKHGRTMNQTTRTEPQPLEKWDVYELSQSHVGGGASAICIMLPAQDPKDVASVLKTCFGAYAQTVRSRYIKTVTMRPEAAEVVHAGWVGAREPTTNAAHEAEKDGYEKRQQITTPTAV